MAGVVTPRRMASLRTLRWLAIATLFFATRAWALEVRQTLWGFDGRIVPGRFNPVSLLIANPGAQPFDGELLLDESRGLNVRDAEFAQPIYLAPHTERWVQSVVFVREGSEYRVRWGRGPKDTADLPRPAPAPPARVLLTDPTNPFSAAGGLRAFPDDLFPTSVAATDALDAVALDHEPRWEPARRAAFLDWLRRGGVVLLLRGVSGAFPEFSEGLAVLNVQGDSARIGAGTVLRHAATRRDASDALFTDRGFPPREWKKTNQAVIYDLEATLFQRLASLTRPKIKWWMLNVLTLAYVALIGPLHYRWARKLDYRAAIALFVATVVLFGALFAVVGRRGYGESQTVHSLTIAHALGGGRCDTMQWISAFAIRGAIYDLTHVSPANYYSAVPQNDPVRGRIYGGREGRFLADIPLYSARPFVHRAVMQGDDTSVEVEQWQTDGSELEQLALKPGPGFPQQVTSIQATYLNRVYAMERDGGRWVRKPGPWETIEHSLRKEILQPLSYAMFDTGENRSPDEKLRQLLPLLQARAIGGAEAFQQFLPERPLPADRLQLWIFARAPEGFRLHGQGFDRENGCVLYVQDVFQPRP